MQPGLKNNLIPSYPHIRYALQIKPLTGLLVDKIFSKFLCKDELYLHF